MVVIRQDVTRKEEESNETLIKSDSIIGLMNMVSHTAGSFANAASNIYVAKEAAIAAKEAAVVAKEKAKAEIIASENNLKAVETQMAVEEKRIETEKVKAADSHNEALEKLKNEEKETNLKYGVKDKKITEKFELKKSELERNAKEINRKYDIEEKKIELDAKVEKLENENTRLKEDIKKLIQEKETQEKGFNEEISKLKRKNANLKAAQSQVFHQNPNVQPSGMNFPYHYQPFQQPYYLHQNPYPQYSMSSQISAGLQSQPYMQQPQMQLHTRSQQQFPPAYSPAQSVAQHGMFPLPHLQTQSPPITPQQSVVNPNPSEQEQQQNKF